MKNVKLLIALMITFVTGISINVYVVCENHWNEQEIIEKNFNLVLNETQIINLIKNMSNKKDNCVTYVWLNGTLRKEDLNEYNVSMFDWEQDIGKTNKISNALIGINTYKNEIRIYTKGVLLDGLKLIRENNYGNEKYILEKNNYDNKKTLNELIEKLENFVKEYKKPVVVKNIKLVGKYKNKDKIYENEKLNLHIYYYNNTAKYYFESIGKLNLSDVDQILSDLTNDFVYVNNETLNKTLNYIEKEVFGDQLNNIVVGTKDKYTYISYPIFAYNNITFKDNKEFKCFKEDKKMTQLVIYHVKNKVRNINFYVLCGNLDLLKYYFENKSIFEIIKSDTSTYWNNIKADKIILKPKREIIEVVYDPKDINVLDLKNKIVYKDVFYKIIKNSKNIINKTINFYLVDNIGIWNTTLVIRNLNKNDYDLMLKNKINFKNVNYFPIWLDIFNKNYYEIEKDKNKNNITKIEKIEWDKDKLTLKIYINTSSYNINQLLRCYYLGRFDLCKKIGIVKVDDTTLKIVSKKEEQKYKDITDILKENNLVGILVVYKNTGKETNIKNRERTPEEILKGWTGGKTLNNVLNDLNGKEFVKYENCYELWRGNKGYFINYTCEFIVINKSKINNLLKNVYKEGNYIAINGKLYVKYDPNKILYVSIVKQQKEAETQKQKEEKTLDQKLKEKGLVGYILYGENCKKIFEEEFKNKEINEGIYNKEDCTLIVFKPTENYYYNKNIYVKNVTDIIKNLVGNVKENYFLVFNFSDVKNYTEFWVYYYTLPEKVKLENWLGACDPKTNYPFSCYTLKSKYSIEDLKMMLSKKEVFEGNDYSIFMYDNKTKKWVIPKSDEEYEKSIIFLHKSYLVKYDGKKGLHIINNQNLNINNLNLKNQNFDTSLIDKIKSLFINWFSFISKQKQDENIIEQKDNNLKEIKTQNIEEMKQIIDLSQRVSKDITEDHTYEIEKLLKEYKNGEKTKEEVLKELENIFDIKLSEKDKETIGALFDTYKNGNSKDLHLYASTINEALIYKKTIDNNINITKETIIEIIMKKNLNDQLFPLEGFNLINQ